MYENPLLETHSFNLDSLSHDVQLIKQTLQGWTSIFSQLMEISIETHKQNSANTALLQQLLSKRTKPSKEQQIKLSPIRPTKTEPDEILRQDNFSKIFNNPKKISIMQLQGTPFDSAFESINNELEEPTREDQYLSVPKSMQMSTDLNKQRKNQQLELQPQSAKNTYENKQFAFNAKVIRSQDLKANKENHQHHLSMNRPESKRNLEPPQLSTVVEENQSTCLSPYENNYRYSIAQSHRQNEQCSTSKTSQNSQRPLNYYCQQQLILSENNRSSSKSCYGQQSQQQSQQQQQPLQVNNNINNQQILQQNPFLNNLNNISTKNIKVQQQSIANMPFKQQFELMNQISNQRAKSYSEQNCKKQLSRRCLDLEFDKQQYETSQELIYKVQKNKK